jgi:hypothetical protein
VLKGRNIKLYSVQVGTELGGDSVQVGTEQGGDVDASCK